MNPVETESYTVLMNTEQNIAILIWKKQINVEECQKGLYELIHQLTAHQTRKCLIDTVRRGCHSTEAEEWEISMLQSKDFAFAGQEIFVALVMSEEKYNNMIHDYSLDRACKYNELLKINYFTQREEAMDWLLHESTI